MIEREETFWSRVWSIDLRALALFRFTLGLCYMYDFWIKLKDQSVFFSETGLVPQKLVFELGLVGTDYPLCIQCLHKSDAWAVFVFICSLLSATAFTFGYKTRFTTFTTWLFVISAQERNNTILNAGDQYGRLVLFWAMFVPCGAVFSVDRALSPLSYPLPHVQHRGPTAFAIPFQIFLCYVVSVAHKCLNEPWLNGTAVLLSLEMYSFVTPLGLFLHGFPRLCYLLCIVTAVFEIVAPILAVAPIWKGWGRALSTLVILLMHVGFGNCLYVGLFMYFPIAAGFSLLPPVFWEWAEAATRRRPTVHLYVAEKTKRGHDASCVLVRLLEEFLLLPSGTAQLVKAAPNGGRDLEAGNEGSTSTTATWWVETEKDSIVSGPRAVVEILQASRLSFVFLRLYRWTTSLIVSPTRFVTFLHTLGSGLHWTFSMGLSAGLLSLDDPWVLEEGSMNGDNSITSTSKSGADRRVKSQRPSTSRSSLVTNVLVTFLALYCVIYIVGTNGNHGFVLSDNGKFIGRHTRLNQSWVMFPNPTRIYYYFRIVASVQNATHSWCEDMMYYPWLFQEGSESWISPEVRIPKGPPAVISWQFQHQRWRKYMTQHLANRNNQALRNAYVEYFCRVRSERGHGNGEQVASVSLLQFTEPSSTTPIVWSSTLCDGYAVARPQTQQVCKPLVAHHPLALSRGRGEGDEVAADDNDNQNNPQF